MTDYMVYHVQDNVKEGEWRKRVTNEVIRSDDLTNALGILEQQRSDMRKRYFPGQLTDSVGLWIDGTEVIVYSIDGDGTEHMYLTTEVIECINPEGKPDKAWIQEDVWPYRE